MFSARPLFTLLVALIALSSAPLFGQNVVPVASAQIADATLLEAAPALVLTLPDFFNDPDTTGVRLTTDLGVIDFALYDLRAPLTVANFNSYVQSGRYFPNDPTTNTPAPLFVHRAISNFVIQSGGFVATVNPADPAHISPTQVLAFAAVPNEFGISNTRGTVAMAKVAGNPDSATSQWFINLADNSGTPPDGLDYQNGGFTVFGRVLGDGMTVADAIAAVPTYNFGSPYDSLPLRDYTLPNPVARENLVAIPAITYISPLTFTATSDKTAVATVTLKDSNLLVMPKAQGSATITVTGTDVDGASVSQSFAVTVVPNPVHLSNISTRAFVGTDNDALIGGFIVRGDAPKRVVLRASGPSLAGAGITDFLADPVLEVHDSTNTIIATNDNWQDDPNHQILTDIGLAPGDPKEAALLLTLPSSSDGLGYTAIVRGANAGTGIGLVEVYDMDSGPGSDVGNISTRGDVQTDDGVMIGGFIVFGDGAQSVLVRAIGPSLGPLGITNPLGDPTLTLYDHDGMQIDFNDNWQDNPAAAEIEATGLKPGDPNESAILQTLAPGGYTAIVRGAGSAPTGTALVEAYAL